LPFHSLCCFSITLAKNSWFSFHLPDRARPSSDLPRFCSFIHGQCITTYSGRWWLSHEFRDFIAARILLGFLQCEFSTLYCLFLIYCLYLSTFYFLTGVQQHIIYGLCVHLECSRILFFVSRVDSIDLTRLFDFQMVLVRIICQYLFGIDLEQFRLKFECLLRKELLKLKIFFSFLFVTVFETISRIDVDLKAFLYCIGWGFECLFKYLWSFALLLYKTFPKAECLS
jgi:hypothetical protein